MFKKRKNGGYVFGRLRGMPEWKLEELPLPDKVIIPLKQGFGAETHCLVKKGEEVVAGQIIGRDDHTLSSPVHTTVTGMVEGFVTFRERGEPHSGVVIRRRSDDRGYIRVPGAGTSEKSGEEISEILYLSGVTSLGSRGIPSLHLTSDLPLQDVKLLIIKGVNGEPFALPLEMLLAKRTKEMATAIGILKRLFSMKDNIHVILNRNDVDSRQASGAIESIEGVHMHWTKPFYPVETDELALETVLGYRVPAGANPSRYQSVIIDLQDLLHIYEAVVEGKPLIERTISLGGEGYSENLLIRARVGSPIEHVVIGRLKEPSMSRVLIGGAMSGLKVESAVHPVERNFSSLTALKEDTGRDFIYFLSPGLSALTFSRSYLSALSRRIFRRAGTNIQGEERPCIYCGYCDDVCPRPMVPHLCASLSKNGQAEEGMRYGLMSCIECGLCSFVCPSKIPLSDNIVAGKKQLSPALAEALAPGAKRFEEDS